MRSILQSEKKCCITGRTSGLQCYQHAGRDRVQAGDGVGGRGIWKAGVEPGNENID